MPFALLSVFSISQANALVNRFVLLARSNTIFSLTLGGIVLSPALPQDHHNDIFSFLYEHSDGLYRKALCDKSNISAKSLKDAGNNLRKVENGKALAKHAIDLYSYIAPLIGCNMSVLSHAPAVGLAFSALHQVLEAVKIDNNLKTKIDSTAKNIGKLVKELKKTSTKARKKNQLQAFELEKLNTLFQMIEDGCYKLRLVIEDRGDSIWKRIFMSGVHQASLDSWDAAVEKMKVEESQTKVNIIFYQTQYIRELAQTHFIFDMALSIVILAFLWIIHRNVEQILRRLDPLHIKMIRMAKDFAKWM